MIEIERELTSKIIAAAIEVHKTLGGPGLREDVYKVALNYELQQMGLKTQMEAPVPVVYKGMDLSDPNHPLRIDILVEDRVVIECKSLKANNPIFASQCLTYLRLKNLQVGLVINFGMKTIMEGLDRVLNGRGMGHEPQL